MSLLKIFLMYKQYLWSLKLSSTWSSKMKLKLISILDTSAQIHLRSRYLVLQNPTPCYSRVRMIGWMDGWINSFSFFGNHSILNLIFPQAADRSLNLQHTNTSAILTIISTESTKRTGHFKRRTQSDAHSMSHSWTRTIDNLTQSIALNRGTQLDDLKPLFRREQPDAHIWTLTILHNQSGVLSRVYTTYYWTRTVLHTQLYALNLWYALVI